jgi:MFS superfamily sulfate permease-like transporter
LHVDLENEEDVVVRAPHSAVFSNWIPFRRQIVQKGLASRRNVTVDLSQTKLVDHSVMEKLHELQHEFESAGVRLKVQGLDDHVPLSGHKHSSRKRVRARV